MNTSTHPSAQVQRRAKLFEAGDYSDKGVTVTAEHLQNLSDTFQGPVPVLIEHAPSALEMGALIAVENRGGELFGTITLSNEANALVESSGAKSLSLGLAPDLSCIREVSLVRNPRIPSARLFGGDVTFEGELVIEPNELDRQWRALRERQTDQQIQELMREGRLCPAQASFARALLLLDDTVQFEERAVPVGHLAMELIRRQPKLNLFAELAPAPQSDYSQHLMLPEEAAFYRRHFPDVPLDEIAKKR